MVESNVSLAFNGPALPGHIAKSLRQDRIATAIRRAARATLVGAIQVGRAMLVLAIFAVMLAAAAASGLLIWVPQFGVIS